MVAESSHWDFIVAMVAADIGVALLPVTVCRLLDRRQVRSVRLSDPVIPRDAALVWRRDRQKSPAMQAWIELAQRRLKPRGSARRGRGTSGATPGT